jgi:hypothetical protein
MNMHRILYPLVFIFSASPTLSVEWYEGGTLHRSRGADWQAASAANRLATSGDFVAYHWDNDNLSLPINGFDEVRPYALQLSVCITEATATNDARTQPVSEIAVACMLLMGWLK